MGRPVSAVAIRCFALDFLWVVTASSELPPGLCPLFLLSLAAHALTFSVGFSRSLVCLFFSWLYPSHLFCLSKDDFLGLIWCFPLTGSFAYEHAYTRIFGKSYFCTWLSINDFSVFLWVISNSFVSRQMELQCH